MQMSSPHRFGGTPGEGSKQSQVSALRAAGDKAGASGTLGIHFFCHEKGAVGQAGANQPGWRLFCLERSCLRGFARPRADQAQVFLDARVAGREAQRLLRQAGALFILPQVI